MLGLQVYITKSGDNFKKNVFPMFKDTRLNEQGATELTGILEG